jgi:hypothetical protein
MSESFEPEDEAVEFASRCAEPDLLPRPGAPAASRFVEVYTESDRESLTGRSSLGTGLAQITSRLLDQLATGWVRAANGSVVTAGDPQMDLRGNRVPRDDSPLVSWKRVVAVSPADSLLALVSLPVRR